MLLTSKLVFGKTTIKNNYGRHDRHVVDVKRTLNRCNPHESIISSKKQSKTKTKQALHSSLFQANTRIKSQLRELLDSYAGKEDPIPPCARSKAEDEQQAGTAGKLRIVNYKAAQMVLRRRQEKPKVAQKGSKAAHGLPARQTGEGGLGRR